MGISLIVTFSDSDQLNFYIKMEEIRSLNLWDEVIVVDDRVTSFIKFKTKHKLIKTNGVGPFEARRKGVEAVTKEFIQFSDGDDTILKFDPSTLQPKTFIQCAYTREVVDSFRCVVNCHKLFGNKRTFKSYYEQKGVVEHTFCRGMWSFIWNAQFLKDRYAEQPERIGFTTFEDSFLIGYCTCWCYERHLPLYFSDTMIYHYYQTKIFSNVFDAREKVLSYSKGLHHKLLADTVGISC